MMRISRLCLALAITSLPPMALGQGTGKPAAPANQTQSVNVVNQPTVTVAGTLPVRETNNPVLQPFGASSGQAISIPDGAGFIKDSFTVPAGKRLVIEYVSGSFYLPAGQKPLGVYGASRVGSQSSQFMAPMWFAKSAYGIDHYFFGGPVKMYADGGTTVDIFANRYGDTSGVATFSWSFVGYLIDYP